ncbi:dihydroorotate dehydrogenase [Cohnella lupini]|uniref:Dihydroorotate dehydrogenase n=2 Tax=Cohnella lupini TaxID=1294267 RepID=A0A3D9I907_9BACL|nr:dihydroorotate dehydrogenase [Cohnella lupini]
MLQGRIAGIPIPTPVGLSGIVDPQGIALKALSQFGFGFIEVGPVTLHPIDCSEPVLHDRRRETIIYPCAHENEGLAKTLARIERPDHSLPQFVRIAPMPGSSPEQAVDELKSLIQALSGPSVAGFYLDFLTVAGDSQANFDFMDRVNSMIRESVPSITTKPLFLHIPLEYPEALLSQTINRSDPAIWSGYVLGHSLEIGRGIELSARSKELAISRIQSLRSAVSGDTAIIASAAIHEPQDALDMFRAGADNVLLNSGLVFSGPGFPKRVNEAIIYDKIKSDPLPESPSFWKHWGWMCLLGLSMIVGGMIAWLIAASSVVLPYDEEFLGMTRAELQQINDHLLHFMSHDRITLAGTMISIGILYYQLAKNGLRHGLHWARTALMVSGVVGFPSFFLYLGYGFFDPIHAAAAAVLFPMFLLAMRRNPDQPFRKPVNLINSKTWRLAMWGQLCFVALGIALSVGGIVIAGVGVTHVFVPQDLTFMEMSREQLEQANPKLIPLIAHDRAGFGGALFSNAVMLLVLSLWGLQQGERWLWWTLLAGGSPAFIAGLSVHYDISYTDFVHLLPAYIAVALYVAGLILLYPYLMRNGRWTTRKMTNLP